MRNRCCCVCVISLFDPKILCMNSLTSLNIPSMHSLLRNSSLFYRRCRMDKLRTFAVKFRDDQRWSEFVWLCEASVAHLGSLLWSITWRGSWLWTSSSNKLASTSHPILEDTCLILKSLHLRPCTTDTPQESRELAFDAVCEMAITVPSSFLDLHLHPRNEKWPSIV